MYLPISLMMVIKLFLWYQCVTRNLDPTAMYHFSIIFFSMRSLEGRALHGLACCSAAGDGRVSGGFHPKFFPLKRVGIQRISQGFESVFLFWRKLQ